MKLKYLLSTAALFAAAQTAPALAQAPAKLVAAQS
jgi:hypothetical protein